MQENESIPNVGALVQQGKTVQQNQVSLSTAQFTAIDVQKPRVLKQVQARVLAEVEMAGEDCYYSWEVKNEDGTKGIVQGPSVKLAMIVARNWGNCRIVNAPTLETPTAWIFESAFVDLETGFCYPRQFRQSKFHKVGGKKMDAARKEMMLYEIGQSKAHRNCIVKAMPEWLLNAALELAMNSVRVKISRFIDKNGIDKARRSYLAEIKKLGVTEEMLIRKYQIDPMEWGIDTMVAIFGDMAALKSKSESIATLFPEDEEETPQQGVNAQAGDVSTHQGYEKKPTARAEARVNTETGEIEDPSDDDVRKGDLFR